MKHYIILPNGRKVTVGEYTRSWKILKQLPLDRIICLGNQTTKGAFSYFPETAQQILERIKFGVHDRINKHLKMNGRKYSSDYERAALQCSYRVNTPNLIVRETEIPFEFRERLRHRIFKEE